MLNFTTIRFEIDGPVACLVMNRPEKLNALSRVCLNELDQVLTEIESNHEIRCLIITGAGEKAFVAGADIEELSRLAPDAAREYAEFGQSVFNRIANLPKPVIAAVNGFALGGGAELAWSCHIRLAADNAKFGQPEINLGLIPGFAGTQRLSRLLPSGKAFELLLTGDMISAAEALDYGLVNYVVPQVELMPKTRALAVKLASKPAAAVALMLKAVAAVNESSLSAGQNLEASLFGLCFASEDMREGTAAFLEKRKPEFKHK